MALRKLRVQPLSFLPARACLTSYCMPNTFATYFAVGGRRLSVTHPNIHTLTMHTYIGKAIGKQFEDPEPKQQSYGAWHFFTIFLLIAGSAVVCYVCVHNRKRVSQQLSGGVQCTYFFMTKAALTFLSLTSGNRTPGSRSYADLVDTWADSTSSYQPLFKRLPMYLAAAYGSF